MPPRKPAAETDNALPEDDGGEVQLSPITMDELLGAAKQVALSLPDVPANEAPPFVRLLISNIIELSDHTITWRTGHLEHIANLFAGDPVTTERNYADDLAVARAYSAEAWERLTNGE